MKLEVQNVSYTYEHDRKPMGLHNPHDFQTRIYKTDTLVLKDVSFTISSGEMVAFLGKNGAGKTTLLRIIPSVLTPISGDILVDEVSLRSMSLHD